MSTTQEKSASVKGGEFIIKESSAENTFIPEEFNEEHLMIQQTAHDFLKQEVQTCLDRIDAMEPGLMPSLMDKSGQLGLLGVSVPEEYGGFGKDFITATLLTETLGAGHSFSVAFAAHTGIGTLPILYFGTPEQKQKYLPKLATGEWKASYCLTEPGSGSDALAAKTKAVLSSDGKHYILNGQKMWITNAGFADVFTVFAQVDGDKFTGFIVEKNYPGLTLGEEEHKMGIKGSSTRQVFFSDCKVPVENVLGEIGKGHLIAFNILNIGRLKLCAAALGGAKEVSSLSVSYANTREQFKLPISKFGAIRYKLAQQAIRIYACESALYRTSFMIDELEKQKLSEGVEHSKALLEAAEEYAVECAMLKVDGSETLDYVVDEGVQIYGGYGFSADFPMDRAYRDSRINRIFEGTNEINRLLTVDMILKRAMKGKIDLMTPAMNVQKELMGIPDFGEPDTTLFAEEKKYISNFKKALLVVAGAAVQKLMMTLAKEQEILMNIADMATAIYVGESILLRTEKLVGIKGEQACASQLDMMRIYIHDAADKINIAGKEAIYAFAEGDEQRMLLMGLKRFSKVQPYNTKEARRRIAAQLIQENKYCF
ncbi:MAG TPA: acyl-CoA dehydrogenase family protein [Bacteroidia bacterium]|nr:MAG: acyl-CoA dehydrogenase domain-containing protein [Bacteroidetes bacterium OLB10]MBE7508808.1 acyl-CoA dehydrogenase family protein [Bacteroidia bacterium]MBX3105875.1 acyl-CoA dehydrogenase family protein [Bacteroidota bacterium]MCE7954918.1 acyl-CoA dehydrogenase [Bacteroidetes bacterium CHB6]OQB63155.1 MAG: putative acyl-CoA dehydrogenase [Bacteroidetes bacterium ADurb.Bin141]